MEIDAAASRRAWKMAAAMTTVADTMPDTQVEIMNGLVFDVLSVDCLRYSVLNGRFARIVLYPPIGEIERPLYET
jgi:hypothetical protein